MVWILKARHSITPARVLASTQVISFKCTYTVYKAKEARIISNIKGRCCILTAIGADRGVMQDWASLANSSLHLGFTGYGPSHCGR